LGYPNAITAKTIAAGRLRGRMVNHSRLPRRRDYAAEMTTRLRMIIINDIEHWLAGGVAVFANQSA
jgi:hypothetical protein